MLTYLAIAVGGTLGCWARYAMTNLVQVVYGREFPYATLSINLMGSFLIRLSVHRDTGAPDHLADPAHRHPNGRAGRLHDVLDIRDGIAPAGRAGGSVEGDSLYRPVGRAGIVVRVRRCLHRT